MATRLSGRLCWRACVTEPERTGVPARAAREGWWMRPDYKLNLSGSIHSLSSVDLIEPGQDLFGTTRRVIRRNGGGDRTRTCIALRPAVFKTAALPLCDPSAITSLKLYLRLSSGSTI